MKKWARHPLFWILLAAAGLRLAGLFWGLPASDGWDDDGFAPRNFLTALALTWKPGAFFTYPPLQALILALPALPVAGWALAHAPSLTQHDVIAAITRPAYMTYFAVLARLVNIAMSLGIIWAVGEMARLVAGRRAGLCASLACALNVGLTYYGQVSNLDAPYLFWSALALLAAMRAVVEQAPRRFWWAALFASAAIATKDQAYAVFALSLPLFLALWFGLDKWPRAHVRQVLMTLAAAGAAALVGVLLVDGAITNPGGFGRRLAFLAGPASRDYAQYLGGFSGWWALLGDAARHFARGYGLAAMLVAALGVALHLSRPRDEKFPAGLLPLLAAISFTLCFNFAALRSDDRFLLPQAVLACVYIGIAADCALRLRGWKALPPAAALVVLALFALHRCIAVDAVMLLDPRYDAERWMAAHVQPGDAIETYGQNCFLPRFPQTARVSRVGQGDLKLRNPLPGVTELKEDFLAPRAPRFIVVSGVWVRRYLIPQRPLPYGRIYSRLQQADFANTYARLYFAALDGGRLPYRLVHVAHYQGLWPAVHIHDSLAEPIGIYERLP